MRTFLRFQKIHLWETIQSFGLGFLACLFSISLLSATPPPPQLASDFQKQVLWSAYQDRYAQYLAVNQDDPIMSLFEPVLDEAFISPDETTAVLWLALRDYSGQILATEPGMALATLSNDGWQVLLNSDPG